jgi:hypothetical protein
MKVQVMFRQPNLDSGNSVYVGQTEQVYSVIREVEAVTPEFALRWFLDNCTLANGTIVIDGDRMYHMSQMIRARAFPD